jgi:serine phosphatase RsbU (regulator of sigma subunit)
MRLQVLARANIGRSAEVIEDKVITAVYDFVGDAEQFDDMTLMVIVRE